MKGEGIRAFNLSDSTLHFYEFDINGGITQGICKIENQNIYYEYDDYKMTDKWIFKDKILINIL